MDGVDKGGQKWMGDGGAWRCMGMDGGWMHGGGWGCWMGVDVGVGRKGVAACLRGKGIGRKGVSARAWGA